MELTQDLYYKAFKNTKTYYEVSDEDPDYWEEFFVLNDNATKADADAYTEAYVAIFGQGDDKLGLKILKEKIKEVKAGIDNGKWIDEEAYNKKFD